MSDHFIRPDIPTKEYQDLSYWVGELYHWQYSHGDNFNSLLFTLMQKADPTNKGILSRAYPIASVALQSWCEAGDFGDELFRQYGYMK